VIFKFLGFLAECFVFSYLGLTFFSYKSFEWSSELIVVEFLVILIGRFLGTFGLIGLLKLCGYEKHDAKRITWKELGFIWYAGLIRGAIAFGLVLRIDKDMQNRGVIVTTCLTLVVFTTIFFGSTVGVLGKCLFHD
jgi:NhaP-type Na+/H+ or K+/H+ antiporter